MFLHGVSSFLITSAVGYWVLTIAQKERGQVKKTGQLLGIIIVLVSLVGVGCKIYALATGCPPGKMTCPYGGKMGPPSEGVSR